MALFINGAVAFPSRSSSSKCPATVSLPQPPGSSNILKIKLLGSIFLRAKNRDAIRASSHQLIVGSRYRLGIFPIDLRTAARVRALNTHSRTSSARTHAFTALSTTTTSRNELCNTQKRVLQGVGTPPPDATQARRAVRKMSSSYKVPTLLVSDEPAEPSTSPSRVPCSRILALYVRMRRLRRRPAYGMPSLSL